jgi:glutamate racemase
MRLKNIGSKMAGNKTHAESDHPIGVFDSGIGGLSVLRAIHKLLPSQPTFFLADQAHVPYGVRTLEQVRSFSEGITRFLIKQGAELIVVACNTASAAALHHLRNTFPTMPFVGMEPAVKPAAESTKTGVVGVLATPATFQGELYASVVERFARDVKIIQDTCPGLVSQIEKGKLDNVETIQILRNAIVPMLSQNIDTIVLGCTHYPFVIPQIKQIAGAGVRVIDPAPAIARQTARILEENGNINPSCDNPNRTYYTSGDITLMRSLVQKLSGEKIEPEKVRWGKELLD